MIPVLVFGSIIGLFLYVIVGAAVTVMILKVWDHLTGNPPEVNSSGTHCTRYSTIGTIAGITDDEEHWIAYTIVLLFWPAVLSASILAGLGLVLGYGPFWVAKSVGRYLAKTQLIHEKTPVR